MERKVLVLIIITNKLVINKKNKKIATF